MSRASSNNSKDPNFRQGAASFFRNSLRSTRRAIPAVVLAAVQPIRSMPQTKLDRPKSPKTSVVRQPPCEEFLGDAGIQRVSAVGDAQIERSLALSFSPIDRACEHHGSVFLNQSDRFAGGGR